MRSESPEIVFYYWASYAFDFLHFEESRSSVYKSVLVHTATAGKCSRWPRDATYTLCYACPGGPTTRATESDAKHAHYKKDNSNKHSNDMSSEKGAFRVWDSSKESIFALRFIRAVRESVQTVG